MKKIFASIRLILTLKCDESSRLVSESIDRDMLFAERWAVRLHYLGCWSCRRFRRQLEIMRTALQRFESEDLSGEKLNDEAKARIQQAINQAQGQ